MAHPTTSGRGSRPARARRAVATVLVALSVTATAGTAALLTPPAGAAVPLLPRRLPMATTVNDATGRPIASLYDQYREPVPAAGIAPSMKDAIVAIEDRRFYDHGPIDPAGILRALLNDAAGKDRQGGSTLTEQYVKNVELYVGARTDAQRRAAVAPTLTRRLLDARLAVAVDRALSKDQILAAYLDAVSFGRSLYGVAAAARGWFATTPDRLTVAQAALLAGMVRSPAGYDPLRHPDAARARRDTVLAAMRDQGMIDDLQAREAAAAPLGVAADPSPPPRGCTGAGDAGFFCAYVVSWLQRAGIPPDRLTTGGYTVRTTLDPRAQAAARAAVRAQVPPRVPHVADVLSLVEPGATAHPVVAMAASREYGTGPGETVTGLPYEPVGPGVGSVYKIFTAAAALEQGIVGIDTPVEVPASGYLSPIYLGAGGRPVPVANAGSYPARLTLTEALARSPNTAFVRLEERTGVGPVVDIAQRLGLTSLGVAPAGGGPSPADAARTGKQASFTLGVTPTGGLELANVLATLASHGTWCPPDPVLSVTDREGNPVPLPADPCRQAVAPRVADALMAALGRDTAPGGTSAAAAAAAGWSRPVAAKTGTTQRNSSAAFVAATPGLAAAAIVFDDSPAPGPLCDGAPPRACRGGTLFGGGAPARTVFAALGPVLRGRPVEPLPRPR